MFKRILALTLSLMLVMFAVSALAEDTGDASDTDTVTATGTATVTLKPDMATFSVGVSTQDVLVVTAQTANATAMQSVIDSLKALGIAADDLQTDNYSISPVYDYQTGKLDNQQILKGYIVSNTVTVTVRNLDQLPALLDAAVAAGANQTYGVTFASSKSAEAYDQAMAAAAQDALRKAKLLAQAIGREAGDVLELEESSNTYTTYASNKSIAYDAAAATPIETGTLSVSANVSIVVEMP